MYQGVHISTGVDDDKLSANGITFTEGNYRSLPEFVVTAVLSSNTKVALGQLYDGVDNGKSTPSPSGDINLYLQDGIRGLDLGTGVANLPFGSLIFDMTNIVPSAVGDALPDILVTQIADPSASKDSYEFLDENGNVVGNRVEIIFTNIPSVGKWTADFYEASKSPMTLETGFKKTERDLRLWAGDFADFGLTQKNVSQIRKFRINLSGNSDVAFVAYNGNAFVDESPVPLPITLASFGARQNRQNILLDWVTATEENSSHFEVQVSQDGKTFSSIGNVAAAGNSNFMLNYSFKFSPGNARSHYFRLKQVDLDGTFEYSKVVTAAVALDQDTHLYPNPAKGNVVKLQHPLASGSEKIVVWSASGVKLLEREVTKGSTETELNVKKLPKGMYQVVWQSSSARITKKLLLD
ncbi:T9SS type A sorting domain-containing protein [uncultured Pontibacter sp.]|uniref:T9SS type A sorting domain-containing protein n=1 Tax=uncultured Pontibacter sp. TaxID=453356 RepID=UPI002638BBFD|nr:T9SS type A sorting domain-containing protein [uncultured Pontibacter sp.]